MKPRKGSNEIFHYITAFGVEKEWSKVFADSTIPSPDWYDCGAIQAFSAATLTTDIVAFTRTLSASITAKSSGGNRSSGREFSGGGGGGGGGGSW